jgi:adenylate cyclase
MNESFIGLPAWLTQAGLDGAFESEIVSGFCDRCVAAGLPLDRALVFIDTLHPVHEGRLFRWGPDLDEPALLEYGRTSLDALAASGSDPAEVAAAERWRRSAFYRMLQTGDSLLRRRVTEASKDEFAFLEDIFAAGMTDYVAIIVGFAGRHAQAIPYCTHRQHPYRAPSYRGAHQRKPKAAPDRDACRPACRCRCGQARR